MVENIRLVRSARYASEEGDWLSKETSSARLSDPVGTYAMCPIEMRPSRWVSSSSVLIDWSRYWRENMMPSATTMPATNASAMTRRGLGETGGSGGIAA